MEEMGRCSATGLRYAVLYNLAPYAQAFPPIMSSGLEGGYKPMPPWCLRSQHWRQFGNVKDPKGTRSH